MDKLRVFLITQEEPFYLPKMIRHLIAEQGDDYEIIGATRLQPHRKNKSMGHWFRERLRIYTWWELAMAGGLFAYTKLWAKWWSKLSGKSAYSVHNAYRRGKITEYRTEDVNAAKYITTLRDLKIDVIISISPPQIFESALLNIPTRYGLNAHGTLLPRHRGVFGSFWTLFDKDKEAGATIHTMVEKLDDGDILWQEEFPVTSRDTQYSIARRTKGAMSEAMPVLLHQIRVGEEKPIAAKYSSSYHRAPTKADGKAFHKAGHRVIRWRDLKYVLAAKFPKEEKA